MDGACIYTRKQYNIYKVSDGFIIHNTHKPFNEFHTHVNNYNLCKIIIYAALKGDLPNKSQRLLKNKKVLESIIRITEEDSYVTKYKELIEKIN